MNNVEKRILQRRRTTKARQVLVPLIEDLLEQPVGMDVEDREWITGLLDERAKPREKGVFSPSMLGSCQRQAFFAHQQVEKRIAPSPRMHGYFIDGDFRHFKWQFILWKLHRAGKIKLIGCEIRVYSKRGDFAGTIDALVEVDGEVYLVDFKGMNQMDFMRFVREGTTFKHRLQIVGYAIIVNSDKALNIKVSKCLLIGENKPGPLDSGSPTGLQENMVDVQEHKAEVQARIKLLRSYAKNKITPEPECVSVRHQDFLGCPFSYVCRGEVAAIQREREKAQRKNPPKRQPQVSRGTRTSRP